MHGTSPSRRIITGAIAVTATTAIVAGAFFQLSSRAEATGEAITTQPAAEVTIADGKIGQALANVKSVSGTFTSTGGYNAGTTDFFIAADGSFLTRSTSADSVGEHTRTDLYNASTGITTTCQGREEIECQTTNEAPYGVGFAAEFLPMISQAENSDDTTVTKNGDNYRIEFDTKVYMSDVTRTVVVDLDGNSGAPTKITATTANPEDYGNEETIISNLVINPNLTLADLQAKLPKVEVKNNVDSDFHFGATNANKLGLPTTKLAGFEQGEVLSHTNSAVNGMVCETLEGPDNLVTGKGTATYAEQIGRNGLLSYSAQLVLVSTCDGVNKYDHVEDFNNAKVVKTFTVDKGALAGAELEIFKVTSGGYVLFGANDKFQIDVAGTVSVDQLVEIANNYSL